MKDPMLTPCIEWEEKLAACHPEDLSPAEWQELTDHTESCPACAALLADYKDMDEIIHRSLVLGRPLEMPAEIKWKRNSELIQGLGEQSSALDEAMIILEEAQEQWQQEHGRVVSNSQNQLYALINRLLARNTFLHQSDWFHSILGNEKHQGTLEHAIKFFNEILRANFLETSSNDYAQTQFALGHAYCERTIGIRRENLELALTCYQESLRIFHLESSPYAFGVAQLRYAEIEAEQEHWNSALVAYTAALAANEIATVLGSSLDERNSILKEGRNVEDSIGYVLTRLGRLEEVAVALERGRTRGLAETMTRDLADPRLIDDPERRSRYVAAREALGRAHALLLTTSPANTNADALLCFEDERLAQFRQAKYAIDITLAEIRATKDPGDFLYSALDSSTILGIAEKLGEGHVLVYLAATSWGGVALAAFSENPRLQTPSRFAALHLPQLTNALISELLEARLDDDDITYIVGGMNCIQTGKAFDSLRKSPGNTLREKAESLHTACVKTGVVGTFDEVTQWLLADSSHPVAPLFDEPLSTLSNIQETQLENTLYRAMLPRELHRSLFQLAEVAFRRLMSWLSEEGAESLTLIPCGALAAFPLVAVPLADGRTVGETLPTSIVPSARSLLNQGQEHSERTGIYALGNPSPSHFTALPWGEAEALSLAQLGQQLGLATAVKVQSNATRAWLIDALDNGFVVHMSCHGVFDQSDFLQSRLLLANYEALTLAEILDNQVDMRGLRLLILSACQTAMLDPQETHNEVQSLAAALLQAGAQAVLTSLWAVDDKATCLLVARFAQEWFSHLDEPPTASLARAQRWLRTISNRELDIWTTEFPMLPAEKIERESSLGGKEQRIAVRGRGYRFEMEQSGVSLRKEIAQHDPDAQPYADPYYWAGFQIIGC